jgi:hypothetical protein
MSVNDKVNWPPMIPVMRKRHLQTRLLILPLLAACAFLLGFSWGGGGTRIGDKPPEIRLPGPSGGQVTLDQQKGKVVVLYFWSDLCSCAEKLPKLNKFYRQNKDRGLVIIAVNVGQTEGRVARAFT